MQRQAQGRRAAARHYPGQRHADRLAAQLRFGHVEVDGHVRKLHGADEHAGHLPPARGAVGGGGLEALQGHAHLRTSACMNNSPRRTVPAPHSHSHIITQPHMLTHTATHAHSRRGPEGLTTSRSCSAPWTRECARARCPPPRSQAPLPTRRASGAMRVRAQPAHAHDRMLGSMRIDRVAVRWPYDTLRAGEQQRTIGADVSAHTLDAHVHACNQTHGQCGSAQQSPDRFV